MINKLFALILFLIMSPIFLFVGILVYLSDGFPIIHRQTRVGYNNKEFDFFKLSSKNLIIHTLGDLTYGELLVKELKKDCIKLLPLKAQLLPEK